MYVDAALRHVHSFTPDPVEQLGAGEDAIDVAHKEFEQFEFRGAERHEYAAGDHTVTLSLWEEYSLPSKELMGLRTPIHPQQLLINQ